MTGLLKDGYRHLSGLEEAVLKNIDACEELASIHRTSLGPNGIFDRSLALSLCLPCGLVSSLLCRHAQARYQQHWQAFCNKRYFDHCRGDGGRSPCRQDDCRGSSDAAEGGISLESEGWRFECRLEMVPILSFPSLVSCWRRQETWLRWYWIGSP